jgi:hypothetical protein
MDKHFVGQGQNSAGGREDPAPTGTSLAVQQFCAFAFGWSPVHSPSQPFRVVAVRAEEMYCLGCCDVRHFDVVHGDGSRVSFCRCCGAEF